MASMVPLSCLSISPILGHRLGLVSWCAESGAFVIIWFSTGLFRWQVKDSHLLASDCLLWPSASLRRWLTTAICQSSMVVLLLNPLRLSFVRPTGGPLALALCWTALEAICVQTNVPHMTRRPLPLLLLPYHFIAICFSNPIDAVVETLYQRHFPWLEGWQYMIDLQIFLSVAPWLLIGWLIAGSGEPVTPQMECLMRLCLGDGRRPSNPDWLPRRRPKCISFFIFHIVIDTIGGLRKPLLKNVNFARSPPTGSSFFKRRLFYCSPCDGIFAVWHLLFKNCLLLRIAWNTFPDSDLSGKWPHVSWVLVAKISFSIPFSPPPHAGPACRSRC